MVLNALALGAALVLSPAAGGDARHQDHPAVYVDAAPCVGVDIDELRRRVELEFALSADVIASRDRPFTTVVELTCRAETIQISLTDPVTRKRMTRNLDATSIPDEERARLLALTVVEFVHASWVELTLDTPPAVALAEPAPPVAIIDRARRAVEPAPAPARGLPWSAGAGALMRAWPGSGLVTAGGYIELRRRFVSHLQGGVDLDVTGWDKQVDPGHTTVVMSSGGAHITAHGDLGRVALFMGVQGRLGLLAVTGHSDQKSQVGTSFVEPWSSASLCGGLTAELTTQLELVMSFGPGLTLRPVRVRDADQRLMFAVEGVLVQGSVGLAGRW